MNAIEVEQHLRHHIQWRQYRLIPQVVIGNYIADYVCISPSGYATELEVKVSLSDWKADLEKYKWRYGLPRYISKFIYVVPHLLLCPSWVPPQAGVWHVQEGKRISVYRAPKRIGQERVPEHIKAKWMSWFYYRYWQQRIDIEEGKLSRINTRAIARREAAYD